MRPDMEILRMYLPQLCAMVALSYLVALCILATRISDLLSGRKTMSYYEDWDGTGASVSVMRPTRQLTNLFEFPVLFYLVVVLAVMIRSSDQWMPALCWAYVALRWAHAISHIGFNRLWIRTPVFVLGQFVLLSTWARLVFICFG